MTNEFTRLYAALNPRQKEAVDAIDGPVMVVAGPGTGKTNILTLRIAKILTATDTPPEAILALTFTESGASEMRARLAAIIGTDAYRVMITTFHSFCNGIIRDYPESLGALAGATLISDDDQAVMLQERINDPANLFEYLRPVNAPDLYLRVLIHAVSTLKREGVTADALVAYAQREERAVMSAEDLEHEKGPHKGKVKGVYEERLKQAKKLRELALVYTQYQSTLRAQRLFDYNDMIMEVARVLETDETLRLILQEQHQYILVDEHQDTNNTQNRIVELLARFWETPNLFVVGDEKQAIYRFQGASLENFHYFQKLYPSVKLITLEDNYRSSQLILTAAEGVRSSAGGALAARSGHADTPVSVMALSSPDVQYWSVARHIQDRLAAGARPESIAVLARDNSDAVAVSEFLRKLAIPFTLSTQQDIFSDPYLHQLVRILDALRNYGSAGPLLIALHAPALGVDPLDVYKLTVFCKTGRNPYDVIRSTALMHEAGIDGALRLQEVSALLRSWATATQQPAAAAALEAIVRESGLLAEMMRDENALDALDRLHTLYDMIRSRVQRERTLTLAAFTDHLDFLRSHGIALSTVTGMPLPGRVRVMTAHKSKGLEFDYVYIIDAIDARWGKRQRRELLKLPPALFLKTQSTLAADAFDDDERNLFYVALTRARREVVIAYSLRDQRGNEQLPTAYLLDIRPDVQLRVDTAALEESWLRESSLRYAPAPAQIPQATDREYLNELFNHHGLSVTALNNYLTCPWRYFYTNLIRIPEAPAFALMYGNAVDRALEEYFNRFKEGQRGTRESLVELFETFIRHQPLQQQDLDAALTRGRTALQGYYDQYHTEWHVNIFNQLKVPAVELANGILINGKIDKVELLDATGAVLVVDYKTGKPKSRNQITGDVKDGDGNYLRQLTFYKLLLDRYQDGKYRMREGVIDFVEPDLRGKYHREKFDITPESVATLESEIIRVAEEIRSLAFWNARCGDSDCAYCPLRSLMEKR